MEINPQIEDGVKWFSYMLTMNALVVVIVQFPVVKFASRFSPAIPLIVGSAFVSCSLLIFGIFESMLAFMFSVVLFTIGEVLMFTMTDVLVDKIAKPELRGTYFGMFGFNNLGNVMAPLLGGFLLDAIGVQSSFMIFSIVAVSAACGIPFLLLAHRHLSAAEAKVKTDSNSTSFT